MTHVHFMIIFAQIIELLYERAKPVRLNFLECYSGYTRKQILYNTLFSREEIFAKSQFEIFSREDIFANILFTRKYLLAKISSCEFFPCRKY